MPNHITSHDNLLPVITIDGSSGVGKGTLTARLAKQLDYEILDSGALYRIVGLAANQAKCFDAPLNASELATLARSLRISFAPPQQGAQHVTVIVNQDDVSRAIRTEEVGNYASKIAVFSEVRDALLHLQQNMATPMGNAKKGLVADGRDMGTVVFPNAALKIYLIASPDARTQRRVAQLHQAGKAADYDDIFAQIVARDERDSSRSVAPAKPADDAIVIDTSQLDADTVYAQVWQLCEQRGLI